MDGEFVAENNYVDSFDDLPLQGQLSVQPWSGDYWPTDHGGIAYRWHGPGTKDQRRGYDLFSANKLLPTEVRYLSPAEKFDLLLGRSHFNLTRKERRRTQILKTIKGSPFYEEGFEIPYWEGLCHAWAVAALAFKEPKAIVATVERGPYAGLKLPLASADIKALLTYFIHETPAKTQFLGQRCEFDLDDLERQYQEGLMSRAEYRRQRKACLDTNAGAFHLVLTNQIGRMDEGFVMDVDKETEVWNHPVYSYKSVILDSYEGASPGAARGTVRELVLKTSVRYIQELDNSWHRESEHSVERKVYFYRVELNKYGQIIGGAWKSEQGDRPDFLYKSEIPAFGGIYKLLGSLYEQATTP
jgi:hypothetical protein